MTVPDKVDNKKAQERGFSWALGRPRPLPALLLEEREGFEPSVRFRTPDFESGTFDHSATSPVSVEPQIIALNLRLSSKNSGAQRIDTTQVRPQLIELMSNFALSRLVIVGRSWIA